MRVLGNVMKGVCVVHFTYTDRDGCQHESEMSIHRKDTDAQAQEYLLIQLKDFLETRAER